MELSTNQLESIVRKVLGEMTGSAPSSCSCATAGKTAKVSMLTGTKKMEIKEFPLPETLEYCMICNLAMPLGLSTIVVPAAYGKDSTVAASMALISHLLSCITIPIVFFFL